MLDKRTNVLLTQNGYNHLYEIAKQKKSTVSRLIRSSVEKTYNLKSTKDYAKAINEFAKAGKKLTGIKVVDIKELISYGRKY